MKRKHGLLFHLAADPAKQQKPNACGCEYCLHMLLFCHRCIHEMCVRVADTVKEESNPNHGLPFAVASASTTAAAPKLQEDKPQPLYHRSNSGDQEDAVTATATAATAAKHGRRNRNSNSSSRNSSNPVNSCATVIGPASISCNGSSAVSCRCCRCMDSYMQL